MQPNNSKDLFHNTLIYVEKNLNARRTSFLFFVLLVYEFSMSSCLTLWFVLRL